MAIDAKKEITEWVNSVTPEMLFMDLRRKVWGQERELRKAAMLIYAFFYNLIYGNGEKYHFLIEGTSGCGKSTFAHALKSLVPFPVIIADASQVTASGYRGAEASSLVDDDNLMQEWCGCGIIILDEIDKLMTGYDQAFHRAAQENFLKMLDGDTVILRDDAHISCDRILFIGMGAFSELREKQQNPPKCIGFDSGEAAAAKKSPHLTKEELVEAGCSEQLLGRFITVLHFRPLGRQTLHQMVHQAMLEVTTICGCVPLSEAEINYIVTQAIHSEFGCRSIRSAVWERCLERLSA